jgi:ribosomal protein L24E
MELEFFLCFLAKWITAARDPDKTSWTKTEEGAFAERCLPLLIADQSG